MYIQKGVPKKRQFPCRCTYCQEEFLGPTRLSFACDNCRVFRSICPKCGKKKDLKSEFCKKCTDHKNKGGYPQKGIPKQRNTKCTCRECAKSFLGPSTLVTICDDCLKLLRTCPKCGNIKNEDSSQCVECYQKELQGKKGKTYLELYGTSTLPCGFQPGENNVAKRDDIRLKIQEGVIQSYRNPELLLKRAEGQRSLWKRVGGTLYRSLSEVDFAEYLTKINEPFEYEKKYFYSTFDKESVPVVRYKLVDFYLPSRNWAVELTGFIWNRGGKSLSLKNERDETEYLKYRLFLLANSNKETKWFLLAKEDKVVTEIQKKFSGKVNDIPDNFLILSIRDFIATHLKGETINENN